MTAELNTQSAPFPVELEELVAGLEYRPGWRFRLVTLERDPGCSGLTFEVLSDTMDTYHPEQRRPILHYFVVPAATYNRESWQEWIRDRLLDIEIHECCEYMQINGKRPFAPGHAPGWNPYAIRTVISTEAAETDFRGVRHEGTQE
jgi:hypothetical protein